VSKTTRCDSPTAPIFVRGVYTERMQQRKETMPARECGWARCVASAPFSTLAAERIATHPIRCSSHPGGAGRRCCGLPNRRFSAWLYVGQDEWHVCADLTFSSPVLEREDSVGKSVAVNADVLLCPVWKKEADDIQGPSIVA
jgi:hypothetical protein